MGLGKTIQSMCFIKSLQDSPATGVRGPFLIVAPLSLIGQWQSEAKSWTPDLNVVLYHGSADARDFLVKQEFFYTDQFVPKATAIKLKKQHVTKFHILITTYEVVLKDINVLSKIKWRTLIVDEAHRLKNSRSRLFDELATVPRDYCVLLTGTPLANATEELWALLHFANPSAFDDKDDFLEKFGVMTDTDQVNALHNLLKPYLLRRVKEDVEKSLPPKEETILEVSLTPIQKKYYKAIYERNTAFLFKGSKPSNSPSLMNVMMELRKCCNHPFLVRGAEERIIADAAASSKNGEDGEVLPIDSYKLFGDQLVKSSGKMVLIAKLLPKLFANGHKVLIFSQMVRVLDLLEELLRIMKYRYERLDGSTSSSSRAAAVDRFVRKSCQRFVMLLSTRAGGLGLNLTAADVVIIFDSDWNPQNDLQAMARAHRIGQTRAVRVYRLLTAKTYEMHMFHSASMKLGLERAILSQQREQTEEGEDGKMKPKSDKEAQAKEIDELLKKGAYDVFRDDDDEEGKKFMETDIDQLLERNTKTVTYDAKDSNSGGLGSFSKASFVADTGDGEKDVDLDDPDFWSKAVGLEAPVETPEEIAQMLDDGVKRSRKQVQQFDPYAEFAEAEQRKQDKIAMKVKAEKEEKDRIRFEKRKKKKDEKERKRREREELRGSLFGKKSAPVVEEEEEEEPKPKKQTKESKPKKPKKGVDRKRLLKRAQNADPVLERLKQAWDTPQRNRAIAGSLRFGFTRFCKIRNESNLTSLCIQDLEVFFRSCKFQCALFKDWKPVVTNQIAFSFLPPQTFTNYRSK
jgi:superfamily II DNA or RNA helicase